MNQYADDALEALVMKNEIKFLTNSVVPLLQVEHPPRLQALLKAITLRIKVQPEKLDLEIRQAESNKLALETLIQQSEFYAEVINHTNADVRKCCVFLLVEIYSLLNSLTGGNDEIFNTEFLTKLNPSQQKLVDIYVKRKMET